MVRIAYETTSYNGDHMAGERNDCAVRALMTVTGSTYRVAWGLIKVKTGRPNRKGTPTRALARFLDSGTILGCTFERTQGTGVSKRGRITLARFVRQNLVGTFYVLKRGHAFAIVDGVVVDTWKPGARSLVFAAWRVTKSEPKPAPVAPKAQRTSSLIINHKGRVYRRCFAQGEEARKQGLTVDACPYPEPTHAWKLDEHRAHRPKSCKRWAWMAGFDPSTVATAAASTLAGPTWASPTRSPSAASATTRAAKCASRSPIARRAPATGTWAAASRAAVRRQHENADAPMDAEGLPALRYILRAARNMDVWSCRGWLP